MSYAETGPKTLDMTTLEVPEKRMSNPIDAQMFVRRLIDNDDKRGYKRSRINGLVDGRPPYKASKLKELGRSDACNVNFGRARSYLESGSGAFYDLFSEAPGYITMYSAYGNDEQKEQWSNIISEEADITLKREPVFDYEMSLSIDNMVLHGTGPLMFEDRDCIFPKAFLAGDLKVPEFTKSDTFYWEVCMVQGTYYPPELYEFIRDAKSAEATGWNVEYTKSVIANAMSIKTAQGVNYEWEFYQQELKNNALAYMDDDSKICRIAHLFLKEFDGRITHLIIERDQASANLTKSDPKSDKNGIQFLYENYGRYESFQNAIHPMYFDHGNGGYHHSVTGLGVKMYSSFEYENRLVCNLCDKAFAPKILFKPTTAEASQRIQLARYGDYGVLPRGTEAIQNPVAGLMQDGVAMYELLSGMNSSILSSYQQMPPVDQRGNPPTKWQKQYEASMQAALSKTQFNRYYAQLDQLYAEIYRRLTNRRSTDERAKDFQKRCEERGVPPEAFKAEKIQATRVVGQGNAFMRKQSIDSVFPIIGALPEDGRERLIKAKIAAEAGQAAVLHWYPKKEQDMATDQQAEAMLQVAAMKVGVPPVITSNQDAVTYAETFLQAGMQSLQSLQKGADPHEVLSFLQLDGPAIAGHLRRFAKDPTRQQVFKAMSEQWKQLAGATDKLKGQLMKQAKEQQAQQQRQQQVMSDAQLKMAKTKADIQLKQVKTQAQLKQSQEKHQLKIAQTVQDMQLKDATTAHDMAINRLSAFQE